MRRNAIGKLKELRQPCLASLSPLLDFDPILSSSNGAQDRDDEDCFERMMRHGVLAAGVLDNGEIGKHLVNCAGGVHL